ncbi:MAG TPA: lasso peptide biosynthesis B2 protein, partial [Rhodothermales bacterium]
WSSKKVVHEVSVLLVITRAALALLPYRLVQRAAERFGSRQVANVEPGQYQRTLTWAASGIGRYLLGERPCLVQAMVVKGMLARAGVATDLRIGVRRDVEGTLTAHAWLEQQGEVILGGRRSPSMYLALAPLEHGRMAQNISARRIA